MIRCPVRGLKSHSKHSPMGIQNPDSGPDYIYGPRNMSSTRNGTPNIGRQRQAHVPLLPKLQFSPSCTRQHQSSWLYNYVVYQIPGSFSCNFFPFHFCSASFLFYVLKFSLQRAKLFCRVRFPFTWGMIIMAFYRFFFPFYFPSRLAFFLFLWDPGAPEIVES